MRADSRLVADTRLEELAALAPHLDELASQRPACPAGELARTCARAVHLLANREIAAGSLPQTLASATHTLRRAWERGDEPPMTPADRRAVEAARFELETFFPARAQRRERSAPPDVPASALARRQLLGKR